MAYSDYGAFVYENGKRSRDREDVAVFDDQEKDVPTGYRIFANIVRNREKYGPEDRPPWWEHSHHAVLGDGPIRLCGYKQAAELWAVDDNGTVARVDLRPFRQGPEPAHEWEWAYGGFEGEFQGTRFTISPLDEGDATFDMVFAEADGSVWKATCGYGYGAGLSDDPDPEDADDA